MSIEWNGEGLPPLGCVCEIAPPIHDAGTKVRVLCHDENAAVCRILEGDRLHSLCQLEVTEIRTVRTEAELRFESAIEALSQVVEYRSGCNHKAMARWLYEAISTGKIPHITLK